MPTPTEKPGDRWWRGAKPFPTPTERFVDLLSELLPSMSDEQRVRLEDAFSKAVEGELDRIADEARAVGPRMICD